jgi:hypothetical protein
MAGERGALLFVSTWDSESDAREFERALRATVACWDRAPAATREIFRHATQVRRNGTYVGLVRGLPLNQARQALGNLPQLVDAPLAAAPPFGAVEIPPVRRAAAVRRPFVQAGRIVAPRLGLSIPIPAGLTPKIDGDDVAFSSAGEGFASLIFAVSDLAYNARSLRHSFETFERALSRPLDDEQTVSILVESGSVRTPVGKGVERIWQVDDTPIRGRLLLVPICRGTGMLVIGQGYASEDTRETLDRAVAELRTLPAGSPICAELDP